MAGSEQEVLVPSWVPFAGQLVNRLSTAGQVPDPSWRDAVVQVPRHHFVSRYYLPDPAAPGGWAIQRQAPEIASNLWCRRVYTDKALVTELTGADVWGEPRAAAICPAPSALLRALAALHVRDGDRVLEMGTGCGWTAALLARRLGSGQVTSVEIDILAHEQAAARLAELGLTPTLLCGDSTAADIPAALRSSDSIRTSSGGAGGGFDQILVAHAVETIPWSWVGLLRPGGRLLARLDGGLGAGGHVLLTARPDPHHRDRTESVSGRFLDWSDPVASLRRGARHHQLRPPAPPGTGVMSTSGATTLFDPGLLAANTPLTWLCQLYLPPGTTHLERYGPDGRAVGVLTARDGAWAEIAHRSTATGRHLARHSGSGVLLTALETAWEVFHDYHQPQWGEFGVTVDAAGVRAWLRDPDTGPSWDLQPVTVVRSSA